MNIYFVFKYNVSIKYFPDEVFPNEHQDFKIVFDKQDLTQTKLDMYLHK